MEARLRGLTGGGYKWPARAPWVNGIMGRMAEAHAGSHASSMLPPASGATAARIWKTNGSSGGITPHPRSVRGAPWAKSDTRSG